MSDTQYFDGYGNQTVELPEEWKDATGFAVDSQVKWLVDLTSPNSVNIKNMTGLVKLAASGIGTFPTKCESIGYLMVYFDTGDVVPFSVRCDLSRKDIDWQVTP